MATANNEFFEALAALEKERGLPEDYLVEKIKAAIVIAVKKDYEVEPRQPSLQGARRFQPNGPGKCQRLHPLRTVCAQLPGRRHRCRGSWQGGRQQVPAVSGLRALVPDPLQAVHLGRLQRFGRVVPLHLQGAPQGTGILSVNHLKNPA